MGLRIPVKQTWAGHRLTGGTIPADVLEKFPV
jgi:hypothetical protein